MGALRLLRGWIELEEIGALAVAALASGSGATAVEALWRAGRPRLALLAGGVVGPAMLFGGLFGAERLLGFSTPQALGKVGAALGTPTGPWLLGLLALLAAAGLGPLVHHRLRGSAPSRAVAGSLLALSLLGLALAPAQLRTSLRPWWILETLTTLISLALAVAAVAHAQGSAQALSASVAGRFGLGPPQAPLAPLAWARARLGELRGLLGPEAPWERTEQGVRVALGGQEAVLDRAGGALLLAAGLELLLQLTLARQPELRGVLTQALALRGPDAERDALTLVRAGALLLLLGPLLFLAVRPAWRPSPRTGRLCLAGVGAELSVLLASGEVNAATLGLLAPLTLFLAALVAGVFPLRLVLPLLGGYVALAAYPRAVADELGLMLPLPAPGRGPGPALAWELAALVLIAVPGLGWGPPWTRLLAVAAGSAAGGALTAHAYAGLGQDDVWLLPEELWAATALPALGGGALGALLVRGLSRAGAALAVALSVLALATTPPWGGWAEEPGDLHRLRAEASAGSAPAALGLGERLFARRASGASLEEATAWHRRAAEAGDPRAMHRWGCLLLRGREVPRDRSAGRGWVERAARAGWPGAVERLTWEDEAAAELDAERR